MCVMVEDADSSARQGSSTSQPQGLELSLSFPISVVGTPIVPVSPNCCETLTRGKRSARGTCVNSRGLVDLLLYMLTCWRTPTHPSTLWSFVPR